MSKCIILVTNFQKLPSAWSRLYHLPHVSTGFKKCWLLGRKVITKWIAD